MKNYCTVRSLHEPLYLHLNKVMREFCKSYGSSCGWTYWCATGPNHDRKTSESPDRSSHMMCYFLLSVRRSSLTKSPSCDRATCWIWWWYQIGEAIVQGIKWTNWVLLVALCLAWTRVDASLAVISLVWFWTCLVRKHLKGSVFTLADPDLN